MVRVLLTNDDGVHAEGLASNIDALHRAGHDVVVVAPSGNRSAMGHRVTVREEIEMDLLRDEERLQVWSCSGTPADCVRVAYFADWIAPFDVVISGTNHGVNLGEDTFYSGTFAAALEATFLGVPAAAASQAGEDADPGFLSEAPKAYPHADYLAHVATALVGAELDGIVFNINLPHTLTDSRMRLARLGSRHWDTSSIAATERDGGYTVNHAWASDPRPVDTPGTDFALLPQGFGTITPLNVRAGLEFEPSAWNSLLEQGLPQDIHGVAE